MKTRTLIALALCAAVPALAAAKKPKKVETPEAPAIELEESTEEEETPVITQECMADFSIAHTNIKIKNFVDAKDPWYRCFNTCPNYHRSIYSDGAKLYAWMFEQAAGDEAKKAELRREIIRMYNQALKWIVNDPKYTRADILADKGIAYYNYFEQDSIKLPAYGWLKESLDLSGKKAGIAALSTFFEVSYDVYKSNPAEYQDQFMNDYSRVTTLLGELAADKENKNSSYAAAAKTRVDQLFTVSGAASCEKLDALYANYVALNKSDLAKLNTLLSLYRIANCTESDVYFAAAEAVHQLSPSEESAAGCAAMSMKKGDWEGAVNYYLQAVTLDQSSDNNSADRAKYLFRIAYVYFDKLHNYPQCRAYCRRSLGEDPAQGGCYILIGSAYASSQPYSSSEMPAAKAAIMNKTVYWAAVDQFVKAKQADPSVEADANKMIAQYSKYFPTKEEIFDLPNELGGETFTVGGWIGETTKVRAAK